MVIANPILAINNEDGVCWKATAGLWQVAPSNRSFRQSVSPSGLYSKPQDKDKKCLFSPLRWLKNPKAFGKVCAAIGDQGEGEGGQLGGATHLEDDYDYNGGDDHSGYNDYSDAGDK